MDDSFQRTVRSFLADYLPREKGLSPNTVIAYRDTFILLLRYIRDELGVPIERIGFSDLGQETITGFLVWLSEERDSSARTCNSRLTAIRSFYRYAESVSPEIIQQAATVLSIKNKKTEQCQISYLTTEAVTGLLAEAENSGIRNLAMLALLYDSGARVQELCDTRVCDLHLKRPATVMLTGKGRKTRVVPLAPQVASILAKYLKELQPEDQRGPLFVNYRGEAIGRAGVAYVLETCAAKALSAHPGLMPAKVTPHMLRHSKSVHMLEDGGNLVYIRDYLGHKSVVTTEMYAKASPELKRKAIEEAGAKVVKNSSYSPKKKKDLLNWLKENI
jgi:site-specific recombinase XerD